MASAVPASASGRSISSFGAILVAAAGVGLLLHAGQNCSVYVAALCSALKWLAACVSPWIGLALLWYQRAPSLEASQTADSIGMCGNLNGHTLTMHSRIEESSTQQHADTAPVSRTGIVKRLARRLSLAKRIVKFGREPHPEHSVEVPFMRRRNSYNGKSSRASSEVSSSTRGACILSRMSSLESPSFSNRRQPSMARIMSGQNLFEDTYMSSNTALSSPASSTKGGSQQATDSFVYNGHLAVDCLPYDTTEPAMAEVKQVVTEQHLLQFGMIIGESSAELAIGMQGAAHPVGPGDSLYGPVDCPEQYNQGWESIIEEHKEGLHYWVSRRHLRKGLYMYKSRTVYERATTHQMVAFTFGPAEARRDWDESATALQPIPPPSQLDMPDDDLQKASHAQSSFLYARQRFPPPMAQREYVYARRVWYKADDGGCYCIARACQHPSTPAPGCRTVRVADFSNGFVIRAVPGIYSREGAVEVVTNYFEDSCAHSGIVNMAIRKALWPMIQKSDQGLRRFVSAHGQALPPRRMPPFPTYGSEDLQQDSVSDDGDSNVATGQQGDVDVTLTLVGANDSKFDTAFTNATMFSGYYPALTNRLLLAPILYSAYVKAWRLMALASKALLSSARLSWKVCCRWHKASLSLAQSGVQHLVARLNTAKAAAMSEKGGMQQKTAQPQLASYPLKMPMQLQRSSSMGGSSGKRTGMGRMAKLVAVAAKAIGMPLVHRLLNERFPSRDRSTGVPLHRDTRKTGFGSSTTRSTQEIGQNQAQRPALTHKQLKSFWHSRSLLHVMLSLRAVGETGNELPQLQQLQQRRRSIGERPT